MSETCAVCRKGKGPEKCEVCGFSDDGFINRQFPIPEHTKDWIETVVKPYRAQWKAKQREAELQAQLEEAKKQKVELLVQLEAAKSTSTIEEQASSRVTKSISRMVKEMEKLESTYSPTLEEQTSSKVTKSIIGIVILFIICVSVTIIKNSLNSSNTKEYFDKDNGSTTSDSILTKPAETETTKKAVAKEYTSNKQKIAEPKTEMKMATKESKEINLDVQNESLKKSNSELGVVSNDKPTKHTLSKKENNLFVAVEEGPFSELVNLFSELANLCHKKRNEGYYCGIGSWTSNSKDMALRIAILRAKGDMASQISVNIESGGNWSSSITNNISERITGIRQHTRINWNGNKMKNSEICKIANIEGKVSLRKIREYSDIAEYYILVNGEIAGSCIYQKGDERQGVNEFELYTIKVGEEVSGIQTQETRTVYDKEKKEYTVYVMVTLPKALGN